MIDSVREGPSDAAFVTSVRRGLDKIEVSRRLCAGAGLLFVGVIVAVAGNAAFLSVRDILGALTSSRYEALASEVSLVASVAVALTVSAVAREFLA